MPDMTRDDYNAVIRQRAEELGSQMQCFGRHLADEHNPANWSEQDCGKQYNTVEEFSARMCELYQFVIQRDRLFPKP